jgi:hypothetical protein
MAVSAYLLHNGPPFHNLNSESVANDTESVDELSSFQANLVIVGQLSERSRLAGGVVSNRETTSSMSNEGLHESL